MDNVSLEYRDIDGWKRNLESKGCKLIVDKVGRFWFWNEQLKRNLSYKAKTREDCLLQAIDSLLFTIELKDQQLSALQRISDLASAFADQIKPDVDPDD